MTNEILLGVAIVAAITWFNWWISHLKETKAKATLEPASNEISLSAFVTLSVTRDAFPIVNTNGVYDSLYFRRLPDSLELRLTNTSLSEHDLYPLYLPRDRETLKSLANLFEKEAALIKDKIQP